MRGCESSGYRGFRPSGRDHCRARAHRRRRCLHHRRGLRIPSSDILKKWLEGTTWFTALLPADQPPFRHTNPTGHGRFPADGPQSSGLSFCQIAMPYHRAARIAGQTKFSSSQDAAICSEAIFSFSVIPLRLATWPGSSPRLWPFSEFFGVREIVRLETP